MDLPERAKAMYKTWWSFVSFASSAIDKATGAFLYTLTDAAAAASDIAKSIGGAFAAWDPIGLSQLFSAARNIANVGKTIADSTDDRLTATLTIPEAPWSRPAVDQLAAPSWTARSLVTYINEIGDQVTEYFQPGIDGVLPATVGDLKSQVAAQIDQSLQQPTGVGSPRRGQLISVDSITLMVV